MSKSTTRDPTVHRLLFALAAGVAVTLSSATAGGPKCARGDVEYVSDLAAHRSDPEVLGELWRREVQRITDPALKQRVLGVFEGKICKEDPEVLEVVERITRASDEALRSESIFLLRYFPSESATVSIRRALNDESSQVRLAALASVSYRHDADALPAVRALASTDPERPVRKYAKEVAGTLAGQRKDIP